jgi:succinate dehydrogenase / fumarate reductase membrane anchor subunit
MSRRSPLGQARGLGAAKEGVGHWWAQRLTSLALIPLTLWFVVSVAMMTGAGYEEVRGWAASPVVAGLMILLIVVSFYHMAIGLQVVIEDYVGREGVKIATLILVQATSIVLGLIGVLSVLLLLFRV